MNIDDETVFVDPTKIMDAAQGIQREAKEFDSYLTDARRWLIVLDELWKGDAADRYLVRLDELFNALTTKFEACATAPKELAEFAVNYAELNDNVTAWTLQTLIEVQETVEKADWASI